MSKPVRRDRLSGAYVAKPPRETARSGGAVDLVTTRRLQIFDEKLDRAYRAATETLAEIRAAVRK